MNMSWTLVIWLSIGAYAFKMLGFVVVGSRTLPDVLSRCLMLIPAALLGAMVFNRSVVPKAAAAAIATAAVARELCGFCIAEDRFCDSGDSF